MAELTEFVDAETAEAVAVAAGAPIDQDAPTPRKYKRRGRVTKWLAIGWLFFIIFSAVGANWLPYVKHSCSQYSNPLMCSTHVKGTPLKIERPPVWAFWAHPERSLPGSPERAGWMGTHTAPSAVVANNDTSANGWFRPWNATRSPAPTPCCRSSAAATRISRARSA